MRANLLARIPNEGLEVTEKEATEQDLLDADELFLTNALNGIRWVRQFRHKTYDNAIATRLYHSTI
jgi:branched-chain amino acid aminotransferase